MSTITAGIRFLGIITALLSFCFILLSLLGALFLSHKFYSPIKASLALFDTDRQKSELKKNVKDAALLQNNIRKIIRKNQSLEELLKEYDASQKNVFLQSLLESAPEQSSRLTEQLAYYQIALNPNACFVVFCVSIDNSPNKLGQYSEKQLNMLSVYIRENVTEKILASHKGFFVQNSKDEYIIVMEVPEKTLAKDTNITELGKAIHLLVGANVKFTFTVGIGKRCKGMINLHQSCAEARMAVNYRLILGNNSIIFYEDIEDQSKDMVYYPYGTEKKILDAVRTGDRKEMLLLTESFSDNISCVSGKDTELVRYYFLQLVASSAKCFYEIDRNFGMEYTQKEFYEAILSGFSIQDMTLFMKDMYNRFLDYMDSIRSRKNKEKTEVILRYISTHLASDLSLEVIADRYMISVYQLRRLFKEELGISPKDYIDKIRISKAIELLSDTQQKIGNISEQIGYISIQSFTRAFKIATGKTPSEYRQHIQTAPEQSSREHQNLF